MEERCDQIMDCIDESDEDNCKMIEFKNNYNKRVPPFTIEKEDHSLIPAKIWASTQLENVLAISEFSHTIDLKLGSPSNGMKTELFTTISKKKRLLIF